jgi:hypothetical protein
MVVLISLPIPCIKAVRIKVAYSIEKQVRDTKTKGGKKDAQHELPAAAGFIVQKANNRIGDIGCRDKPKGNEYSGEENPGRQCVLSEHGMLRWGGEGNFFSAPLPKQGQGQDFEVRDCFL